MPRLLKDAQRGGLPMRSGWTLAVIRLPQAIRHRGNGIFRNPNMPRRTVVICHLHPSTGQRHLPQLHWAAATFAYAFFGIVPANGTGFAPVVHFVRYAVFQSVKAVNHQDTASGRQSSPYLQRSVE
jgi:hypothetical protein